MSEPFDPYRKWLGILPAEQPPDHYRLLGIVRFEDDADTISHASDRQMAHVRTFQAGPHSLLSQKLLNEIAAARVCLLDPVKKAEYDRQLRASEGRPPQPAVTAPNELVLRPIDPTPPATGVARSAPPAAAWQPPPTGVTPRVPVPVAKPLDGMLRPVDRTPVSIAPLPRRPPPKIRYRKPRRVPSDAQKTLFIAAALAAIAVAAFVVYRSRAHSGANQKVTPEEITTANQLISDDAEQAREVSKSPEATQNRVVVAEPTVVVAERTTDSPSFWEKLTRQLNDLDSWKIASGQWSEKDGRLYGAGDSRLTFQEELPDAFLLSFEMTVVEGMRPRIFFGDRFHFGNEGYDRKLFVHDGISPPMVGAPRPYATGVSLKIVSRLAAQEAEFAVNDELVARCGFEQSGPLKLTVSAGDWWSKGQVYFGPFTLGPAPSKPLAALPSEKPSGSVDPPAPRPASPQAASKDGGWRDLFDGKSLANWTGDVHLMRVQNGTLISNGKRAIVTAPGDYDEFELEIEFRLSQGGNSGLGIYYAGGGDPSQNGLEVQMLDDAANRRLQDMQRCGAVYGLAPAQAGHFKRWPDWNRLRVTTLKDNLRVELNGSLVTDTTRSLMRQTNPKHPGVSRTSGKICLFPIQGRSEYRHFRIRSAK